MQIVLGSVLLIICSVLHVAVMAVGIPFVRRLALELKRPSLRVRTVIIVSSGVLTVTFAHAIQVWLWAFAFYGVEAFDDFATSFYFSMVTYTTLGYGDIVLGSGLRVFGTFASITGLLTFGISTAFLIGLVTRLLKWS